MRSLACLVLLAATARAAPTPAEQAFERGRTLLDQGQVAEACGAFAESVRLDFQYGALFNLATCEERRGHLASALEGFRRIVAEDQNATRSARSREHIADLEPRVARLRVAITGTGATLAVDGRAVDAANPIALDPGAHRVVVSAPGAPDQTRTVEVTKEREVLELAIDARPPLTGVRAIVEPVPRSRTGVIVVGAGAATTAAGLVLGGLALHGWRDAEDRARSDPDGANRDLDRVRLYGNASTVLVGAGLVAVAVGIYLWRR